MKNYSILLFLLPTLMLSPQVAAQADALNLTVDLGSAQQKTDSFSESDSSASVILGYELSSNWSLNLSYTDFGKVFTGPGILVTESDSYDTQHFIDTKALGLTAQYLTDPLIAGWAFGARFGLMHVDTKLSSVAPEFMGGFSHSRLDSDTAPTAGALATYNLTEKLALIVSVDYMAPEVETSGIGDEDIKTTRFAAGLKYHF
jgi:opacity protein-like surface antigen